MRNINCRVYAIIFTGLILLISGMILYLFGQDILRNQISSAVLLINGTESFKNWMSPGIPVYMSVYIWHVKNPEDVVRKGKRPSLEQRGPYTYRQFRRKHDVEFLEKVTLLRFRKSKTFIFDPDLSVGPDTDNFTGINIPLMAISSLAPPINANLWKRLVQPVFQRDKLFKSFRVRDYLFGYTDPTFAEIKESIEAFGQDGSILPDKFGIFASDDSANGSLSDYFTVKTGVDDIHELNYVQKWRNMSTLQSWGTPECNMINGTDGSVFHPFIEKDERLYIFSGDICRSIYVDFQSEVINRGIPMYHFTLPLEIFADPENNPDNAGFCVKPYTCMKSGLLSLGPCKNTDLIAMSQPHFLYGDKSYIDAFEGLEPNEKDHLTFLDIEPMTGFPMNVSKRLQINIIVGKRPLIARETRKLNETVWPLVWVDEHAALDEKSAEMFLSKLVLPIKIFYYLKFVLVAVGFILLMVGVFIGFHMTHVKKQKYGGGKTIQPNGKQMKPLMT